MAFCCWLVAPGCLTHSRCWLGPCVLPAARAKPARSVSRQGTPSNSPNSDLTLHLASPFALSLPALASPVTSAGTMLHVPCTLSTRLTADPPNTALLFISAALPTRTLVSPRPLFFHRLPRVPSTPVRDFIAPSLQQPLAPPLPSPPWPLPSFPRRLWLAPWHRPLCTFGRYRYQSATFMHPPPLPLPFSFSACCHSTVPDESMPPTCGCQPTSVPQLISAAAPHAAAAGS